MLKVASFFSGIGGFDLGLERSGMEVVFQCEWNAFCQKVLRKHWPNVKLMGDINEVTIDDVPAAEVWCGGFPCQDVSLANQGKRKGLEGERSGHFYKYAELIEQGRPQWVLVENVPGLLNSNNGDDFRVVISTLEKLGYGVAWRVLDAKYFGTPQRRRRVYIVASYRSNRASEVLFEQGTIAIASRQGLGQRETTRSRPGASIQTSNLYSIQHAGIGRKASAGPQAKGYRNDGETYTLDSRGSSDAVCQTDDAFGVREAAGFSGGMDGSRFRTLGNAVAVPVINWIGKRIIEVEQSSLPMQNED
ncbi:DNA cytosine methyltransferase [Paenibacillus sp. V4I7]|uniref:DNA cytosine methyltransferase n=1 Tax=Paenibacillus sp. V4I7 TaxID=3042307 RepID=UPI00277F7468|nr:DNA (cytosine-5-)-methyltransferase [Paenibacillus sp. V4I7]MDQ0902755.1 DNA (cytosine-5)-methyltransferase 1 [Paenibacillus sp. V4I7]